jgi:hypothetical protein
VSLGLKEFGKGYNKDMMTNENAVHSKTILRPYM